MPRIKMLYAPHRLESSGPEPVDLSVYFSVHMSVGHLVQVVNLRAVAQTSSGLFWGEISLWLRHELESITQPRLSVTSEWLKW